MQMAGNHALILVEEAHPPADLDAASLRERLQQAERELESAGDDTEKRRVAERDKNRLEAFQHRRGVGRLFCRDARRAVLAERLISYDTSRPEEIVAAAGFVKGWLESREIEVRHHDHNGLPVLVARSAAEDLPCVVFHGHLDVVPAHAEQFHPRVEDDRLIGRGAYDMKGGLAGMMCAIKDLERQRASGSG